MSLILNLETSTKNCSVSIAKNGVNIAYMEENTKIYNHSEKLHIFIQNILKIANIKISDIDSICVDKGPGAYSSLRFGTSSAKGLCISLGIPLLSMDSLSIMFYGIDKKKFDKYDLYISMIHAKNKYFYISLFDKNRNRIKSISKEIINNNFFEKINYKKCCIIGNYDLCFFSSLEKNFLSKKNFFIRKFPSASDMSYMSHVNFSNKNFHNIYNFSPVYL